VARVVKIDHVAVWTRDLDRLRSFYEQWFGARAGMPYASATRPGFRSYFLTFPGGGARLELMTAPDVAPRAEPMSGYAHLAVTVGTVADVDALVERMRAAGVRVVSAPRRTGDGYYEAVIEDPDGNLVEIAAGATAAA